MQFFGKEKINKLEKTSTSVLTLPLGSKLRIGGRTYSLTSDLLMNTATDIDTGAIANDSRYYVYAVAISKVVSLKYSLNKTAPNGIAAYRLLGGFLTAGSTNIENIENNIDGDNPSDAPGKISAFGMGDTLDGYLPCDGRTVSRTMYADLYSKIGNTHGEGDGSTTFHLPDLRGRFLRGQNEGSGRDPDAGSRTASNTGGATGDTVGSVQGEATSIAGISNGNQTVNHYHESSLQVYTTGVGNSWVNINGYNSGGSGAATTYSSSGTRARPFTSNNYQNHSHNMSGGGNETRSLNANVRYGIKY